MSRNFMIILLIVSWLSWSMITMVMMKIENNLDLDRSPVDEYYSHVTMMLSAPRPVRVV